MAEAMPPKENSEDDPYDIEYYERTGGKTGDTILQEIRDSRREIRYVKMKQNAVFKYSITATIGLLVLNVITLTLLLLMFNAPNRNDENNLASSGPTATIPSCTIETNGSYQQALRLTETQHNHTISVWGSESCSLRVLAVGAEMSEYFFGNESESEYYS